jgi:hypothetical protein
MVVENGLNDDWEDFKSGGNNKSYDSSGMQVFGLRYEILIYLRC